MNIFSRMTQLAAQHGAINLAQGFPDFPCDPDLTRCAVAAIAGENNQYAPVAGLLSLRRAIAKNIGDELGVEIDPEREVTVTAGAAQAIFTAVGAFLEAGEEAIIIEPAYDSYVPAVLSAGGRPLIVRLEAPKFEIDWTIVEKLVSPQTRLILINSPNNPTGRLLTPSDLDMLAAIVGKYDLTVISDEVYRHIVFDGRPFPSVLQHPGLRDRSIVVNSFGKSLHVTGWKVGYCLAAERLTKIFLTAHQYQIFSVNSPAQAAIAEYLSIRTSNADLSPLFAPKRAQLRKALRSAGFNVLDADGTYFQLADYSLLRDDLLDSAFAEWLTMNIGVACIPLSSFYHGGSTARVVRFCFAKTDETLARASQRLQQLA